MKRKINKYIIIGIALLGFFSSCLNLDERVYDKITVDNFGKSEAEVEAVIGTVYKTLQKYWPSNYFYLSECSGDMAIVPTRKGNDWWDGGAYMELHTHIWNPNTGTIKSCWNEASKAISWASDVCKKIENSSLKEENKAKLLGEVRGVRAFWLYVMMDYWGNIPLQTDPQSNELPTLKPRREAYDFILKELNEIKDVVRDDVQLASYGKFTKGAAYTLLAKMYLNSEAWGFEAKWQEAADACDVVMALGYQIETNWKASFVTHNEHSKEIIFPICFLYSDKENTLMKRTLHYKDNIPLGATFSSWNGICAQPDYVKLYDTEDIRYKGSFLLGEMIDPATGKVLITAHERPLIHTIDVTMIPGTLKPGSSVWGEVNQEDGARVNKWEYDKSITEGMENDFPIFRLADVYLMKAEALIRSGQNNAEATRLVNVIRERGYGNADHNYPSVTLKEIALERKLELAWECHSRQDNIRFGTFLDARFVKSPSEEYRKLFCIPIDAWQTNNKLVQNPGYPSF